MEHIDYFKLQAKNLLKDFKTRFFNQEEKVWQYNPKFFDIENIFFDYEIPDDKPDFNFTLMNAQHLIAKMADFENWSELKNTSKTDLKFAHILFDNIYKSGSNEFNACFQKIERKNNVRLSSKEKIQFFKQNLSNIVAEKSHNLGFGEPLYHPAAYQGFDFESSDNLYEISLKPPIGFTAKNPKTGRYDLSIKVGEHFFVGSGNNLFLAKMEADKKAYLFLCYEEIKISSSDSLFDSIIEESDEWKIPIRYSGNTSSWSDEEKAKYEAEFEKIFPSKETK